MQPIMSVAGCLAMPASFLGSGRVSVPLPVLFMHADGVRDSIGQAWSWSCLLGVEAREVNWN